MTPTEKSPDIATLNRQVTAYLPDAIAARISELPQDEIETLGEAYIALVALETPAPDEVVAEVEARLRATENPTPSEGTVPNVVTY